MSEANLEAITRLLYQEAAFIDARDWDGWLSLFTEDVEYWVPAWKSDLETTADPNAELSLIYYESRLGLEDRVFRLRTAASSASIPMPRTCHMVSNVTVAFPSESECLARANFHALSYRLGEPQTFFGSYDYELVVRDGGWKVRRKKIIVINDVIDTVLDFYSI